MSDGKGFRWISELPVLDFTSMLSGFNVLARSLKSVNSTLTFYENVVTLILSQVLSN